MAHRTGAGMDDLLISGTADDGNDLRFCFHEIDLFSIHLSSVQGELPMSSSSTTAGWRGWLGQSLSRSKVTSRSRKETRRRSVLEQLEGRIVLSYIGVVDAAQQDRDAHRPTTTVGHQTDLVITQSGGNLVHNAGALSNVTGVTDWQSGGPATTVAADGSWTLDITPVVGDTIQLGDVTVPASNVPIQVSIGGNNGVSLAISDAGDATGRNFNVTSASVTGSGLAGSATFSAGALASLSIVGGLSDDTFDLNSVGTGSVTTYTIDGGPGNDVLNVKSSLADLNYGTAGVLTFNPGNFAVNYSSIETAQRHEARRGTGRHGQDVQCDRGPGVHECRRSPASPRPISAPRPAISSRRSTGATARRAPAGPSWPTAPPASTSWAVTPTHTRGPIRSTSPSPTWGVPARRSSARTTINVTSQGPVASSPDPIASTAAVAAAALTAQGVPVSGLDGIPLAGSPGATDVLVATFMDAGTIGSPSAYTASIAWGDGSTSAATRITASGTANGTVFSVFGNHTYANNGTFPVVVTITKPPFAVPSPGTPARHRRRRPSPRRRPRSPTPRSRPPRPSPRSVPPKGSSSPARWGPSPTSTRRPRSPSSRRSSTGATARR